MLGGNASESLHARFLEGDASALAEAFAEHRQRLWRMVHFRLDSRMSGRVDPDDVLQEAYLSAAGRIKHYRGGDFQSPFLWLRIIVQQTLVDVHCRHMGAQARDASRESPIFGQYPQATSASLAVCLAGDWTSPSQAVARGELLEKLQAVIATMNSVDQEILAMRHFEELTNGETAAALGIEPKAASIRYVRALRRLKEILAGFPGILEAMQDG
jgi:RNA polymerase sigma-70 factor (ECF subfamily)